MRRIIFASLFAALAACEPAPVNTDGLQPEIDATELSSEAPVALVEHIAGQMKTNINKPWGGGILRSVEARGTVLRIVTQSRDVLPLNEGLDQEQIDQFMQLYFRQVACKEPSAQVFFGVGAKMDLTLLDKNGRRVTRFVVSDCPPGA